MTKYPSLVKLLSEDAYEKYFVDNYCKKVIKTFDGVIVYFPRSAFQHAFYKSSSRSLQDKKIFAIERAERLDWIKVALKDNKAQLFFGWNNKKKKSDYKRRVAIVKKNYIVIVQFKKDWKSATFITAFLDDANTAFRIALGEKWIKK